ncbi:hypothetical protein IEQ34_014473 [Dendrobium chrysotoxum]|uniref:Zinc finger PHD-type domain-containing protein n=1 Tax=Dendrobium chrysotoxum TaxID=161865 RepID=A0AAV7GJD3_DENCH|nr:hypothetical protein IEQ34_014473 [Dendrobium chrysotoxum]
MDGFLKKPRTRPRGETIALSHHIVPRSTIYHPSPVVLVTFRASLISVVSIEPRLITPVLKGSYRMQGPADDSDLEFGRINSGVFPTEEKFMFVNDCIGMKIASGLCNICAAPCSSSIHGFRSSSVMGSTSDSGCSGSIFSSGKADICFSVDVNGTQFYKKRKCDDSLNASSETSNMLGISSSHNSFSENAESKSNLKASAADDLEDLDKPQIGFSGKVIKKEQPLVEKTYQDHFSADSHISIHIGCRDSSGEVEEQPGLECHEDNISCLTGGVDSNISDYGGNLYLDKKVMTCGVALSNSLILNVNQASVLAEAGDGLQVHETDNGNFSLRRSITTTDVSILNVSSNSTSVWTTSGNSGFARLKVDASPISPSLISNSNNICSPFQKADFRDTEGSLNVQLQAGCNYVESSLGSFSSVSSAGWKSDALQNVGVSITNEARSCLSSEKSKVENLCQEFRTDTNIQISSDNVSRSGNLSEPLDKDNALLCLETTNSQGDDLLPPANTEIENSESEIILYDVNVCDICGDAGREALLAICSRCSDGAEHTYCMREKLDKLPGVDWLCEECKIKNTENHRVDKSDTICGGSKPTFFSQNSQNSLSTLIPKKLPKPDAGVIDLNDQGLANGLESPKISTRRQADHVEEIKASEERGAPIETASPRKTPVLSGAISFKNQKIEVKKTKIKSFEDQSVDALQAFHCSQNSFSSGSFKGQPHAHSLSRHFARSVSFNNSIINQKVKQIVKNVSFRQKTQREAISSKLRNETLVKSVNKSHSFKSSSSGFSNTEIACKDHPLHPSRIENPRELGEVKERITVDKNIPSAMCKTSISKLAAPASNCHLKINRSSQNEGNVKSAIESSCQSIVKRSSDPSNLGCSDRKKRILHSSRSMKFFDEKFNTKNRKQCKEVRRKRLSAVDGLFIKVDMASHHGVLQPSKLNPQDNKIRNANTFICPRLSSSGGNQTLHFQKCNKTVHAIQQCSTDKIEGSAHRPSNEHNLIETKKNGKECEGVMDAMVPKTRVPNKVKNLDKFDKVPEASGEVICKADSRITPSSFSQRNIALVVDSSIDNDSLKKFSVELGKRLAATDSVNLAVQPTESFLVPKANSLSHIPTFNELNVKSLTETSPGELSILACQSKASAIPKLEFIWQGSFNILRSDGFPQSFDGIQAHVSTCASHRVLEAASVVPSKIQLEEVSQTSSWPLQYQGIGPKEENIALFYFAKDNDSYEKSYSSLLNKMLKNDLALRGKLDDAELLIFTSKMLPTCSQRWNMLYYLWGMFISKRKHGLPTQKKNCESNLVIEFVGEGISELPLTNNSSAQNLDTTVTSMIFSECDASPKLKQEESTMSVELHCISSEVDNKSCRTKTAAYAVNSSSTAGTDAKITQGIPLFFIDYSSKSTAKPLDFIDNPELQRQASQLSYKMKIGMDCQDKFPSDGPDEKIGESPLGSDINIEARPDRASPVPPVSPTDNPVEEFSTNERKKKKGHCLPTDLAILGYIPRGNILEIDWADRKHVHSCSPEAILQTTGERARWMHVDDEREQKMTNHSIGSSFGEEKTSSSIFSQQQHTQNIYSEPVMPEVSRIVEKSFFPVDIGPSSNNKHGNPVNMALSNDDDNTESYTPDLELTLGSKSKTTKPAALLPLLPLVDRGSQNWRSDPSGNDGDVDDLSALLFL